VWGHPSGQVTNMTENCTTQTVVKSARTRMAGEITFDEASRVLEGALSGESRGEILNHLCTAKTFTEALAKMRSAIRSHTFKAKSSQQLHLGKIVRALDERTKQDGFTVLIDWDGKANRWVDEMIPIDVLDYFVRGVDPVP